MRKIISSYPILVLAVALHHLLLVSGFLAGCGQRQASEFKPNLREESLEDITFHVVEVLYSSRTGYPLLRVESNIGSRPLVALPPLKREVKVGDYVRLTRLTWTPDDVTPVSSVWVAALFETNS